MFSKTPNWTNQLSEALKENPIWLNLFDTVSKVVTEVIDEPRWALARIREAEVVQRGDWLDTPIGKGKVTLSRRTRSNENNNNYTYDFQDWVEVQVDGKEFVTLPVQTLHDRNTMIAQASNSGFDYFSSTLQDDDYARIVTYVNKFWRFSGGDHFVDFMGFIKRTRFEIEQLWTQDIGHPGEPSVTDVPANENDYYPDLLRTSEYLPKVWDNLTFNLGDRVDPGLPGYYYPTSHVELEYNVLSRPNVDKLDVMSLFYLLAPIHLVLERFAATIYVKIDYKAVVSPILYTIQQRSLKIEV